MYILDQHDLGPAATIFNQCSTDQTNRLIIKKNDILTPFLLLVPYPRHRKNK